MCFSFYLKLACDRFLVALRKRALDQEEMPRWVVITHLSFLITAIKRLNDCFYLVWMLEHGIGDRLFTKTTKTIMETLETMSKKKGDLIPAYAIITLIIAYILGTILHALANLSSSLL